MRRRGLFGCLLTLGSSRSHFPLRGRRPSCRFMKLPQTHSFDRPTSSKDTKRLAKPSNLHRDTSILTLNHDAKLQSIERQAWPDEVRRVTGRCRGLQFCLSPLLRSNDSGCGMASLAWRTVRFVHLNILESLFPFLSFRSKRRLRSRRSLAFTSYHLYIRMNALRWLASSHRAPRMDSISVFDCVHQYSC